jgi:hypothetical protein
LKYLNRLEKLNKVKKIININQFTLLLILLIDTTDNHEYFAYKYNISNNFKTRLNLFNKNLILFKKDNNFLRDDLMKNIYLYGKNHLIFLNTLIFTDNSKITVNDFININKRIINTKIPKFPINGKYLLQNGMKEGSTLGRILKIIEDEWIVNGFKISKDRVKEIIKSN